MTSGTEPEIEPARGLDPELRLQHALDLAYRYLNRRARTVAEMRAHLETRDLGAETIETVLAELVATRYLDDEAYAQRFAEDRRTLDAWGPDRIARKLRSVGIPEALVAAALDERDRDDELEAALALLARRFPAAATDDRERQKQLGVLVRKGYGLDLAHTAVRRFGRAT